jgi:hypothetical protein
MKAPSESYLKVHYELRPAKQVERRMLIDAFQMLSLAGFPISDYQYTGFGSIYFVDFILFHKILGMNRLLSVEYSTKVAKRVRFNKPYDCIDIEIKPIGDVIPTLSRDRKHLLWLDYDSVIQREQLADVVLAATYLSPGSLLLVTVDVEPPGSDCDGPVEWREYYLDEAERYLGSARTIKDFTASKLPTLNVQILQRAISAGLSGRPDVHFFPLFNFLYADGHKMLTIGGMIGTDVEQRGLRSSPIADAEFARLDLDSDPFEIRVPRLTRKERMYLDFAMPCSDKWHPKDFELKKEDVKTYRQIYRYFPAYAELLL